MLKVYLMVIKNDVGLVQYIKYSDEERTKVAKRASEMAGAVTNAIRFFRKEFSDPVKLSRGLQICSLWWAVHGRDSKLFMQLRN